MFGILNINKPAGWTSRDVVNRVQRKVRPAKVGHAGTLDPLATGVLVVCVGPATRLIERVQQMPKRYRGTFELGLTSPSDDVELETTPVTNAPIPTPEEIAAKLLDFTGEIMQRPPAYSAVKLEGRRAYDLARQGQQVTLAERQVTIYSLELLRYDYPTLELDIVCGSGTYIRSLGRDLAESLGTGAVMSGLERTGIGSFEVGDSCTVDAILEQGVEPFLQPATTALPQLPVVELTTQEVEELNHGRAIRRTDGIAEEFAGVDQSGKLVAILVPRGSGMLGPSMVFKTK